MSNCCPRRPLHQVWALFASAFAFATLSLAGAEVGPAGGVPVRNLILMIGDGMGPQHVQLAADYAGRPLVMTSLPVRGALKTLSANSAVTDSAAAGTALACGQKTNNGMLGQLPDGTKLTSIAELARDAGKRVGILSSVPLNHATPAAFYAKAGSRNSYYDIGIQALASRFEVMGGSSLSDAEGMNNTPRPEATLWQCAQTAGCSRVRTPAELRSRAAGQGPVIIAPESYYSEQGVPYGRAFDAEKQITLAQVTTKALELLDNPKGFFLMVEGGAIDWAAHGNDALGVVGETLAFDEAVAVAKTFAEANPGTLLVVTADHETGGLTLSDAYAAATARSVFSRQTQTREAAGNWLKKHAAEAAAAQPVTDWDAARGPFATAFGLPEGVALETLQAPYEALVKADATSQDKAAEALRRAAFSLRDAAAGISWSTGGHTATDVPVFAFGPGADAFAGTQDNTQIFRHGRALLLDPGQLRR